MAEIEMEEADSSDSSVFDFMRLPKELRLSIYEYLLLPTFDIDIFPMNKYSPSKDISDSEGDWEDTDSDTSETSSCNNSEDRAKYFVRHPAILRTSRQIYAEASHVLYTRGILILTAEDIFTLRTKPRDLPFGARATPIFRYNPLKLVGHQEGHRMVYDWKPNPWGGMDPHVFARFQKIHFDACFDYEHTQHIELWMNEETQTIRKDDDALKYEKVLQSSPVMRDFRKLISKSPIITSLKVSLEVMVMINSNLDDYETPDDDDEAAAVDEAHDKLMDIANRKATELFVDSRICDTLLRLDNVKSFKLEFALDEEQLSATPYQPPRKYIDYFRIMKEKIEGRFVEATV